MSASEEYTQREIMEDILIDAYITCQQEQEDLGNIPRSSDNVLQRYSELFKMMGAIQVGLFMACLTIILNFVIIRMILHLD